MLGSKKKKKTKEKMLEGGKLGIQGSELLGCAWQAGVVDGVGV